MSCATCLTRFVAMSAFITSEDESSCAEERRQSTEQFSAGASGHGQTAKTSNYKSQQLQ